MLINAMPTRLQLQESAKYFNHAAGVIRNSVITCSVSLVDSDGNERPGKARDVRARFFTVSALPVCFDSVNCYHLVDAQRRRRRHWVRAGDVALFARCFALFWSRVSFSLKQCQSARIFLSLLNWLTIIAIGRDRVACRITNNFTDP